MTHCFWPIEDKGPGPLSGPGSIVLYASNSVHFDNFTFGDQFPVSKPLDERFKKNLARKENTESLNLTDYSNPCEESIEPEGTTSSIILNGDEIFEHIRKKAKSFTRVDEIKSLSTKSYNIDFDFDLFIDAKSNIVQKENVLTLDSDPVKPQLKAATREKQHISPSFANKKCCSMESE
ncbi:hypothetical protein Tco_0855845, partial [Tanacetum coccineum]